MIDDKLQTLLELACADRSAGWRQIASMVAKDIKRSFDSQEAEVSVLRDKQQKPESEGESV